MGIALTPCAVAAGGSAPVSVVNTPLPVTGNIIASGTVAVGGTVQTQDIDNRARHAWQKYFQGSDKTFMVPAGQRLTIEFASVGCNVPSNTPVSQKFYSLVTTKVNNVVSQYILPATYDASASIGGQSTDFYSGTVLARIYADGDTEIIVFTGTSGSECGVSLSGYLTAM